MYICGVIKLWRTWDYITGWLNMGRVLSQGIDNTWTDVRFVWGRNLILQRLFFVILDILEIQVIFTSENSKACHTARLIQVNTRD